MCDFENDKGMYGHKISILMSIYSKEKPEFFDLSLKSILVDQQIKPDELVLIVDGPITDELEAVISKYRSEFQEMIRVYRFEDNKGLGRALEVGLKKCRYEYIARADSDDICAPERLKVQIEYFKKHPHLDILSSYIDEFDEDYSNPINRKQLPLEHEEICKMAKFRNPINHMSVMFKKDKILSAGSYMDLPYLEDYYLWVRAIMNGCTLNNIDQYLVHARIGNGMVQRRGNKKYIESWRTLNNYMIKNDFVSKIEYLRNMIAIKGFIYMPPNLKNLAYKKILRNK